MCLCLSVLLGRRFGRGALLLLCAATPVLGANPVRWRPYEITFETQHAVADPFLAKSVTAEFSGPPEHAAFLATAFSDDGRTYRLRTALPSDGSWTWRVIEAPADSGLMGRTGTLEVTAAPEANPLYRHGFLRVSDDRRHLAYHDGTPFFWLGDTAWNGPWRSTPDQWRHYAQRRAQQAFSVVLVHATNSRVVTELENASGHAPFVNGRPNPAYWNDFDRKIAIANAQGLVVLVAGVGRSSSHEWIEETTRPEFARYLAARLGGYFVVFSPSMDLPHDPINDRMGRALARSAPRHLRTQHVHTGLPAALAYAAESYVDFAAIQSGHARGHLDRSRDLLASGLSTVMARAGAKPTLNLEAMYDVHGDAPANPAFRRTDARQLGYLSWLHGSPGYTYGTDAVWRWIQPPEANAWPAALERPSAEDMSRLREFFGSLPWWELAPAAHALLEQPAEASRRGALAASPARDLVVVFLPEGNCATIAAPFVPEDTLAVWFNPLNGERTVGTPPRTAPRGAARFSPPHPGEWLLVLRPRSAFRLPRESKPGPAETGPLGVSAPVPLRPLQVGETFRVEIDAFAGLEHQAEPKFDTHRGTSGDIAWFRRFNVARAHAGGGLAYWYSSKHQDVVEPWPLGQQWVDYTPPLGILGPGRYRLALRHRASANRAHYPARVTISQADGLTLVEVPQRGASGSPWIELGEFDLTPQSWVRVEDPGPASIVFGPLDMTRR